MRNVCLALAALICTSCMAQEPHVVLKGKRFTVELSETQQKQALGLMFREEMAENHGMLFVYEADTKMSFYMKNTVIPLSIAFLAKDGTIKEIYDMQPESLTAVASRHRARYALEVKQGAFGRLGIAPNFWRASASRGPRVPASRRSRCPCRGDSQRGIVA